MQNVSVLIADGDKSICNLVNVTLKLHDYKCFTANGGESAILLASSNNPDIILLELDFEDMDGKDVIQKIRSWSDVPIIVISSRKEDHDKIMALDSGADDYLTKPFSVEELLARLRVMVRRFVRRDTADNAESVFKNGNLKIDYASGCVYMKDEQIHVTPIEYKLLCMLAKNVGCVLTHSYITNEIWGNSWDSTIATLRTFMASLRKKIHQSSEFTAYIHTHTCVGYRMAQINQSIDDE